MYGPAAAMTMFRSGHLMLCEQFPYVMPRYLQEEFETAELPPGLTFGDLVTPSQNFWLSLPGNPYGLDEKAPLRGIGVLYLKDPERIHLTMWCPRGREDRDRMDQMDLVTEISITEGALRDMESSLTDSFEGLERLEGESSYSSVEEAHAVHLMSCRYVVNLLLHLNMPNRGILTETEFSTEEQRQALKKKISGARSKGKRQKYERRLSNVPARRWVVLDAPTLSAVSGRSETGGETRKVGSHWRAGHYHRYWVGSRTDENGEPRLGERQVLKYVPQTWVSGNTGKQARKSVAVLTKQKYLDDGQVSE